MNKTQMCWMVVNDHFGKDPIDDQEITKSSTLAVAMEYLGLIKEPYLRDYAASRGGTIFCGNINPPDQPKEIDTFSFRELLQLLPD